MRIKRYLEKADKQGNVPVFFSVTANGFQHRFSSREKINPINWKDNRVTAKQPGYVAINQRLNNLTSYLEELGATKGKQLTKQELVSQIELYFKAPESEPEHVPAASFFQLYQQWIKECSSKISPVSKGKISKETITSYSGTMSRLLGFQTETGHLLTLDLMDQKFYIAFRHYMLNDLSQSVNTFSKHIRHLKTFLSWCVDNDHTVNPKYSRFEAFDIYQQVDALTEEELQAIYDLDFNTDDCRIYIYEESKKEFGKPLNHLQVEQRIQALEECRDVFLMMCYTALRRSDVWRIEPKHISTDLITIRTQTAKKPLSVELRGFFYGLLLVLLLVFFFVL